MATCMRMQHTQPRPAGLLLRLPGRRGCLPAPGLHAVPTCHHHLTIQVCSLLHTGLHVSHGGLCSATWLEAAAAAYAVARAVTFQCRCAVVVWAHGLGSSSDLGCAHRMPPCVLPHKSASSAPTSWPPHMTHFSQFATCRFAHCSIRGQHRRHSVRGTHHAQLPPLPVVLWPPGVCSDLAVWVGRSLF